MSTGAEGGVDVREAPPTSSWFALYTRARHEKKVRDRLRSRGFEVYLPLISREREWHDRTVTVDWPMFSSYVFVRCRRDGLSEVLATTGVLTVVRQNGLPAPIRDKVMEDVLRLEGAVAESGSLPEPTPMVSRGRRVVVTSGPLAGVEGTVVAERGNDRVLFEIGIEAIGQGLKVEYDASRLHALEEEVV